ncbi:MAG: leucine-rich repeat protein [Clostridia bacterium]|nr:leucine-rich repeat protein [Clostridia bacterium]
MLQHRRRILILSTAFLLVLVSALSTGPPISAYDPGAVQYDAANSVGYLVNPDGLSVTIVLYYGTLLDWVIPSSIQVPPLGLLPVTAIGDPNGEKNITSIGITSVHIPDSVRSINDGTFTSCTTLLSVDWPDTLDYLGVEVFYGCSNLNQVKTHSSGWISGTVLLPDGIDRIESKSFSQCFYIRHVRILSSVQIIGFRAFHGDVALETVEWGTSPPSAAIAQEAFRDCIGLREIDIPATCASIGLNAFFNTPWYRDLTGDLVIVGDGLLLKVNSNPEALFVPSHVKTVCAGAVTGRTNLYSVALPEGVLFLNDYAFTDNDKLYIINVPESLDYFSPQAFTGGKPHRELVFFGFEGSRAEYSVNNAFPESDRPDFKRMGYVRFESMGGTAVPTKVIVYGFRVAEPAAPLRAGHYFEGWYTGTDFVRLWDFTVDEISQKSTTLYARWSLDIPVGLVAARISGTETDLGWVPVEGADGYDLFRAPAGTDQWVMSRTTETTSCRDTGLTAGSAYQYRVRAYSLYGTVRFESDLSSPLYVSATPVPTPKPGVTPTPLIPVVPPPTTTAAPSTATAPGSSSSAGDTIPGAGTTTEPVETTQPSSASGSSAASSTTGSIRPGTTTRTGTTTDVTTTGAGTTGSGNADIPADAHSRPGLLWIILPVTLLLTGGAVAVIYSKVIRKYKK